jgi:hypothetical protein
MAYETGIDPQALLDCDPEVFSAMCEHRAELVKAAKKRG